jgi:hypothetical protein
MAAKSTQTTLSKLEDSGLRNIFCGVCLPVELWGAWLRAVALHKAVLSKLNRATGYSYPNMFIGALPDSRKF